MVGGRTCFPDVPRADRDAGRPQAHLAQTLYHPQNPSSPHVQQQSFYQPVAGTSALPPVPVSSLNSHFSGSDEEHGHNAVAGPSSGAGWDVTGGAWQKLAMAKRPQATPRPSYYGGSAGGDMDTDMGDDGGDMDMDEDNQELDSDADDSDADDGLAFETHGHGQRQRRRERAAGGPSAGGGGLPSPPVDRDGTESESGYSAFESDAFAPLYNGGQAYSHSEDDEGAQDGGDQTPVPGQGQGNGLARTRSAGSGSGWEAFQKRPAGSPKGGWDRYGFNLQPVHQQGSSAFGGIHAGAGNGSAFGHRPFSPTGSTTSLDPTSQQLSYPRPYPSFAPHAPVSPPPIGLPTPPEEKALPRPLSTPNVQFGFSGMTPASDGAEADSPRKAKRRSGLDEADRRKWEGRLRSAAQQPQQGQRGGW